MGKQESITFWLGCHVLRHSDIIRACVAVIEKLDIEVRAVGGPRYCCGTIKDMNAKAGTIISQGTAKRLGEVGGDMVVSYCPSCQTHLDDFVSEIAQTDFDSGHFVTFLHRRREKLRGLLKKPIRRRIALHLHSGFQSQAPVNEMAHDILSLVPDLEIVKHSFLAPGIHCAAAMAALPGMADDFKASLKRLRNEDGVDDVVTIFHSCQRNLCVHEGLDGLHIVNFIKLLAESMGIDVEDDIYRNWKVAGDEEAVRETVGAESIGKIGDATFDKLVLPELARNKAR